MKASAAVLVVCLLAAGDAAAHEHHSDGKYHLKKANDLADAGKCAAAVKEYTSAYEKLHDPIVLFNRAECYRRLGENAKAAADYRGYLKGFPAAPNRSEIEGRIAALERPPAPPPARAAPPPRPTAPPSGATAGRVVAPPPPVAVAPPRPAAPPPVVPPPPPPAAVAPPPAMPFLPPPPPAAGSERALVEAPNAAPTETARDEGHGSHWLLWTTLAVVAVGGGVAGYVFLRPKDPGPPMTVYGNYRF